VVTSGRDYGLVTTYSAVRTTGIYCRPGCGAKPLAENVHTFELAAAAEAAGYRACLRCRPYRVAGAVGDDAPELVCRAIQLIIGGVLDDGNEAALGARLGVSARHLRRMFGDHLGVTPDQFARSRRAHFARRLLDDSDLSIAEVAFASGFGSLRQFNRAMREVFRSTPRELRERRRRADRLIADGGLVLRMPYTAPYDWDATVSFLAAQAIPGVESVEGRTYRRTVTVDGAPGMLEISPGGADYLELRAHLPHWEGVIHVVERAARLAGIDTDPALASAQLSADPILGPLIEARPGLRVPGAWSPFETAVQSVVGNTKALATLVSTHGTPIPGLGHGLTHTFPSAETLASDHTMTNNLPAPASEAARASTRDRAMAEPVGASTDGQSASESVRTQASVHASGEARQNQAGGQTAPEAVGSQTRDEVVRTRAGDEAVRGLARAVVSGAVTLDGGEPLAELVASLVAVPGVSATAAHHIALRLGARDAFPELDPTMRRALRQHAAEPTFTSTSEPTSEPTAASTAASTVASESWRPWRALATVHLLADDAQRANSASSQESSGASLLS
jgi:AraC family transcriptional regulator, regulatory protein of adaptative response / DNA-3-methyladenine glycosylase II